MNADFKWETDDTLAPESGAAMVRIDGLRGFVQLVRGLGGDPEPMFRRVDIEPALVQQRNATISYRKMVRLLERAAIELDCPDLGMRLAESQSGSAIVGAVKIVMRNSETLGKALEYCTEQAHAYSAANRIAWEADQDHERRFMRFEILLARIPFQRQVVEQSLLLAHLAAKELSDTDDGACEVWFSHQPSGSSDMYQRRFGCTVRFNQQADGLFFRCRDLGRSLHNANPRRHRQAARFVERRFPRVPLAMNWRVRSLVQQIIPEGNCSSERVASLLGLHARTLQRRLRGEGESFEAIRDGVRRDIALRQIGRPEVALSQVAEMLGYSEISVLSRSCHRWFSASPRQVRRELTRMSRPGAHP